MIWSDSKFARVATCWIMAASFACLLAGGVSFAQGNSGQLIHPQVNQPNLNLIPCLPPKEVWEFQCVNRCPSNQHHHSPDGKCVSTPCPPNTDQTNGRCVPKCLPGQVHTPPDGICKLVRVKPQLGQPLRSP